MLAARREQRLLSVSMCVLSQDTLLCLNVSFIFKN